MLVDINREFKQIVTDHIDVETAGMIVKKLSIRKLSTDMYPFSGPDRPHALDLKQSSISLNCLSSKASVLKGFGNHLKLLNAF